MTTDILENAAPAYEIRVEDRPLSTEINNFVTSVEYESIDGVADMAKVDLANPNLEFLDRKLFQPGNEMDVAFGYGKLAPVGRVIITESAPTFPQVGMPMLSVKGYTKDFLMMDNAPEKGPKRSFVEKKIEDIVVDKAAEAPYRMNVDVDPVEGVYNKVQKAGMSDYELIKGLANLTGYLFWVDWDFDAQGWTLHFKKPDTRVQSEQFVFRYNSEYDGALLDFRPTMAVKGATTKLKLEFRDPQKGKRVSEEITEDEFTSTPADLSAEGEETEVEDTAQSAGAVTIFFGDKAIDVPAKRFKTAAELKRWAVQWFRRNRENFVIGDGTTIGVETVMARQEHVLEGVGRTYSGKYYFSRVRHKLAAGSGYMMDFSARKVLDI